MASFFNTTLYDPIYNLLIFLVGIVPFGDIGLAVIAVTIIVKLITLPLSLSMIRTQKAMKVIQPELDALKEKHKDNRETLARETFALYKRYGVNPLSSLLLILIQIPILIALYWVFQGESLPQIDPSILYGFIAIPDVIRTEFLGLISMHEKSLLLAVLAGATQAAQAWLSLPKPTGTPGKSLAEDFGRAMTLQARYVIPVIIAFVAYATSGAVALYFVTSNLFGVAQELAFKKYKVRG